MAAGATYERIQTNTLSSAQSTVTFSSISANYTDLVLIIQGRTSADGVFVNLRLNNDTTNTLSATRIVSYPSLASNRVAPQSYLTLCPNVAWDSLNSGFAIVNIFGYTDSTVYKTIFASTSVVRPTGGYYELSKMVSLWQSTSVVNRIDLFTGSSTFAAGSTFTLYGIKAA
jgi:hypothetical protein